nr:uncharacterized protein LOC117865694 isoform X2 [Setaria viridis]
MIFLIFNVSGWHSNFWISLIPLALLLLIGAKLEHIINKLAYEVATKHFAADEEGLEPFGRAVLVPEPPGRSQHHPLHPVPERVLLLDAGDVWRQLLHDGRTGIQHIKNHHMVARTSIYPLRAISCC